MRQLRDFFFRGKNDVQRRVVPVQTLCLPLRIFGNHHQTGNDIGRPRSKRLQDRRDWDPSWACEDHPLNSEMTCKRN